VRQLDDSVIERLKVRASERNTSVEALAREALTEAARLTTEEKMALVRRMQDWGRRAINPAVPQTPSLELIREDRDHDH
jgi:plasmid stability protein